MDFPRDFGPYRLIKQVAMGGMAEIVLAKTKGFGGFEKLLALKMIHPKFSQDEHFITMLIEEAKICVELDHVNIGQVFDLGKLDDSYFISMEFIEGADIFRIMRRATEIDYEVPIDTCAHIGQEICAGLDYAHGKRDSEGNPLSIIHRDMSPQNVIISYAGEVKIVDFGIAKAGLRAKQTEVGVIKGKYYYMSPEQAWGDPVDHRTDIFSAGIIVYEMLTGQMLYLEENIEILLDRVRKADIAPPSSLRPEIPAELDGIVMRALSKHPEDRYQSAHEMGQDLRSFIYGYSPDYTSARLASMLGWLFDEEAHRPAEPAPQRQEPAASLLMTREDLSKQALKQTGSLLFEMANLEEIAAPLMRDDQDARETGLSEFDELGDFDPTSQVSLPDLLPSGTSKIDTRTASNDATMRLDISSDLSPFAPSDTMSNEPWGDDETYVETSEDMLRHMREDMAASNRAGPSQARQAHDVTRQIDTNEDSKTPGRDENSHERKERNSSYLPPPPPGGRSSQPSKSYQPPAPGKREDRSSSPTPLSSQQPPKPHKNATAPPPPPPPPPPKPKAAQDPLPRPATRPVSRDSSGPPPRPSAPPQPSSAPRPSAPPQPSATPRNGGLSRALPPLVDTEDEQTKQTALIPEALQLDPKVHEETGPTNIASLSNMSLPSNLEKRDFPPFDQNEENTNPTAVLRQADSSEDRTNPQAVGRGAPQSEENTNPTTLHRRDDASTNKLETPEIEPQHTRDISREAQVDPPQQRSHPPRQNPPPWLMGGEFGGAPRPSPAQSEQLDDNLLSAPPDAEDIAAVRKQASIFRRIRKFLIPAAALLIIGPALFFLWPRPAPQSSLEIRSFPPGAQVSLDGTNVNERTPAKIEGLETGTVHQVELRLDGFTPWNQSVELNTKQVRQIAVLSPIRGTLRVTSEPNGASVIIDGVYQGSTPHEAEGLDINREFEITVRYEDQTQSQTLNWAGRTEATLNFRFERRQRRRRRR